MFLYSPSFTIWYDVRNGCAKCSFHRLAHTTHGWCVSNDVYSKVYVVAYLPRAFNWKIGDVKHIANKISILNLRATVSCSCHFLRSRSLVRSSFFRIEIIIIFISFIHLRSSRPCSVDRAMRQRRRLVPALVMRLRSQQHHAHRTGTLPDHVYNVWTLNIGKSWTKERMSAKWRRRVGKMHHVVFVSAMMPFAGNWKTYSHTSICAARAVQTNKMWAREKKKI